MAESNLGRNARVSLVLTPQTKEKVTLLAGLNGVSMNEFLVTVIDEYVTKNDAIIDRLVAAKREFDETRRKLKAEVDEQ